MTLPNRAGASPHCIVVRPSSDRGHAVRAHTADAVIEAWGPTAAACYEEASAAFVAGFVDIGPAREGSARAFDVGPGRPQELLVLLLEEVLFDVETRGHIPVVTEVEVHPDRLTGRFTSRPIGDLEVIGAIPKGVSYSDLQFRPTPSGWYCRATVDV